MAFLDLFIIFIFLVGFVLGYKDGFLRKLIGSLGFILAIVFTALFKDEFGSLLNSNFNIEIDYSKILAAILIFFSTILIFSILKRIIHPFDKINSLLNKLIGGAVGAFQILFFLSAILLLLKIFNLPDEKTRLNSHLYGHIVSIIPNTFDIIKKYSPDTEVIIKDFINEKDTIK